MPDGDVIRRGVRFAWRPAYEGLRSPEDSTSAGGLIARGLTASLRDGGIPRLSEAADLVERVWAGHLSGIDAMRQVAQISGSIGGTRRCALLDQALRRVIVAEPSGTRGKQAVAEAVCNEYVQVDLMSKLRPALLEDEEADPADIDARIAEWSDGVQEQVRQIAQQLVADPTGSGLRAPPSRKRRKRTTSDLLEEQVI